MKIGLKFTTILLMVFFALINSNGYTQSLPSISVSEVINDIKLGNLAGNKNLAFGVRNIIEENLMDLGYPLMKDSNLQIKVRLLFFDVNNVGTNISVFHKGVATTQIIASAELWDNGKRIRKTLQKGESAEISTSTLIVGTDGKFNQQSTSNALKKVCENIIEDLMR
jgi:uncharacterized lipoprotein YajG